MAMIELAIGGIAEFGVDARELAREGLSYTIDTVESLAAQYYGFANSMVEYLYATYGGADGYRKLLVAFKDDARPAIAMPKAIGITPEAFYSAWLAAAKKKYC